MFAGSGSQLGKASWGTGWGAKRGAEGVGFGRLFLLVSLSVGGEAKEGDLGLHGAKPDCSEPVISANSSGISK